MIGAVHAEGPSVVVREAAPVDLPAVHALVATAGLPLDGLADAALVLVADAGGAVIGTVALERHGIDTCTAFLLRSVAVAPAWRNRHVGAALTTTALERVDAEVAPVALLTATAHDWFPRFGFTAVDRTALPVALQASPELRGACPASARAMLRRAVAGSPHA